eukprot:scaffold13825_cov60-Phaeocystis_antarctica.AAC.3
MSTEATSRAGDLGPELERPKITLSAERPETESETSESGERICKAYTTLHRYIAKPVGMNITRRPPQNGQAGRGDIHTNAIGIYHTGQSLRTPQES